MHRFNATRLGALLSIVMAASLAVPVHAQSSFARRRVSAGEVTGLEMGIEGTLGAVPGGRVRWYLTLHEVIRRRDLRVSPGSVIRATATYSPGAPVAEVTTDAAGRAALELVIPEDLESAPHLMLEAISPRGVRRVFEVTLELEPRYAIELHLDRMIVPERARVLAFGRVIDRARGVAAAGHEVRLQASAAGPLGPPIMLETDEAGVFSSELAMPERAGTARVVATVEGNNATVGVVVRETPTPALVVAARPEVTVARPRTTVGVDVLVRTPDGVPVANAVVEWADEVGRPEDERTIARTDAAGRARLTHETPRAIGAPFADVARGVRAVHPAFGTGEGGMSLRVARQSAFAAWAVSGGALVPGLEGRALVQLVGPDGAPLAGRAVSITIPRIGRADTTTDGDGVATIRGIVGEPIADERCGGPTAAAAEIVIDGAREGTCLRVDPDATLTVRAEAIASGRAQVTIARRSEVSRAPVVLSALVRRAGGWAPIAEVSIAGGASTVELPLPEDVRGEVWLRARVIVEGARQVRGGGTLAWIGAARRPLTISAGAGGARVEGVEASETVAVLALDPERADALRAAARASLGPVLAAIDEGAGEARLRMLLAERTPTDEAVSAVLREGEVVSLPLPEEPARLGLLRDPWRTRARFVRGRIGRLMLAVEDYVSTHVTSDRDDVAVRDGRGWRFNEAILEAALGNAGLGGEGAAALDGEPLDIDALYALDPSFRYDNVARRITRERLWRVYSLLRELVRDRQLDVSWARRGDPAQYLVAMLEAQDVGWSSIYPERDHLFDGWGNPLALRPSRGRGRFTFLEPVPGWELVSAGPDGRLGTGDDMVDPFARVLPSGGLYAEAVGEDALLARLGTVALGRAAAETLGEVFAVEDASDDGSDASAGAARALPSRLVPAVMGPVPMAPQAEVLGGIGDAARSWTLPRERRRYAAIALRFSGTQPVSSARTELVAGSRVAVRAQLPSVLRPGDALDVPLAVVRLTEESAREGERATSGEADAFEVEVSSRGGALSIEHDRSRIRLRARRPGIAIVRVSVRSGGHEEWSREARVRVVPEGQLRARHASALVLDRHELAAEVPAGATPWRARLVLSAPRTIDRDPMLAAARDAHPAPFAWAAALRGEDVDPALLAAVTRQSAGPGFSSSLEAACALTAWASADERSPTASVVSTLAGQLGDDVAMRAAVLAALAPSAPGGIDGGGDPVAAIAVRIREDGWRALATTSDRPTAMARMAAALLLADRRDAPGLALLARARAAIVRDAYGRPSLPGEAAQAGDGWIGTLALSIAARQAGDDGLADELGRAAASRLYLASRTGVEGAFWLVAASVYGAFGVDAPSDLAVLVNGAPRAIDLSGGVVEVALAAGDRVSVTGAAVLARVESRFVAQPRAEGVGPLIVSVEGEPGRLGDRSAYELIVSGRDEAAVGAPVIEIAVPSAAVLDEAALASLRRASAVRRVDGVDGAGRVRVHLAELPEGGVHRLPLPWRWIAAGEMRGLDVAAYDASRPWELTVLEARAITVEAEQ